jgi:serine/threonine protein kinase
MPESNEDTTFADNAIKLGFAKLEQVEECLKLQDRISRAGLKPKPLAQLMLAKGYISKDHIEKIEASTRVAPAPSVRSASAAAPSGGTGSPSVAAKGWPEKIAGYRIQSLIGEGAIGSVFKALQISMDRIVAIKILSPKHSQNDRMREKFMTEARTAAKLSHPNIVQAIDVGQEGGFYYFVMEYLDGPTVGHLLKRGGALDERRTVQIVMQVAQALEYAHRHGIVHRDIKPDNIMMTREGVVKLCDLGLARTVHDPDKVKAGIIAGTPYYMSPEQARGEPTLDGRADLYSLGAAFYHMVTGEVPFSGDSAVAVVTKHLTEPLKPPKEKQPLLSPSINHIIVKCMVKNKEERYAGAADLIKDLNAFLDGETPAGMERPEDGTARRLKRPLRRRRRFRR